ncbi:MAG: GNAT family N-acetyltransferase [Alphaproteobacteria bacterium]|nr:GNAT family N-acetyltransferase [Alphaproteobacteria bacterium]
MIEGLSAVHDDWVHRAGPLEVRLAASRAELRAAQALRFRVFYEELCAGNGPSADRLDADDYDAVCDHLLVVDRETEAVVGTYRLLRQVIAEQHRGFYSAQEYDLTPLRAAASGGTGQLLELGRSCVDPAYRTNATISLLWRGIATYLEAHRISHMFGCASFHGTDPAVHAEGLAYLHHHHLAPPGLRVRALAQHHVPMDRIAQAALPAGAARLLPPLIRGYLRVGAMVGDGAFIDRDFNTVDVFVLMPVDRITARYSARFASSSEH